MPAHPTSSPSPGLTLPKNPPPIPDPNPNPLQLALTSTKIGVSVEDLASLPPIACAGSEKKAERLALRVDENLFNFMQSFCGIDRSRLVVPMDILDRWFKKFQERARKDLSYLKDFALWQTGECPIPKNKKERKKVCEVDILKKDPEAIREQIEKLERMSILIVLFFLD
ncbi:hypothetical protein ZIOFF_069938 [Zingiber officinale]|uniref:Hikeshi-like domain-containing protein n=1 Tax=Zingiber officinale TaxID=94328 RepID=A0A8J5EV91_ZINOF|nr:hypothetical protein ZIOFF_069938 [Zingiber officinale]